SAAECEQFPLAGNQVESEIRCAQASRALLDERIRKGQVKSRPGEFLLSSLFLAIFRPLWLRSTFVNFRSNDDRRPSKFIVLADNMGAAIEVAWEHGRADFQSRFDKSTGQAQEMKEGALRVL